jgi:NTP pyrophosphatase (non-canonical NTP hydrolase)
MSNVYTQRQWDRTVGWGKVPQKYTKMEQKMTFDEYQEFAKTTAIYSDNAKVVYPTLGLSGEAGEVAEKVKKNIRKSKFGSFEFYGNELDDIAKEIGDVLWYLSALSSDIGYSLEDIAQMNMKKLKSRQERNKIEGEGDNR